MCLSDGPSLPPSFPRLLPYHRVRLLPPSFSRLLPYHRVRLVEPVILTPISPYFPNKPLTPPSLPQVTSASIVSLPLTDS